QLQAFVCRTAPVACSESVKIHEQNEPVAIRGRAEQLGEAFTEIGLADPSLPALRRNSRDEILRQRMSGRKSTQANSRDMQTLAVVIEWSCRRRQHTRGHVMNGERQLRGLVVPAQGLQPLHDRGE